MHIPDGFLDMKTIAATAAMSVVGVGVAIRQIKKEHSQEKIVQMGLLAAFIFAAQMVNFPVLAGTSGHLLGTALVVNLLGWAPAVLVMTSVLVIQSLLFADGGVLALGANVFNMAIGASLVAYVLVQSTRSIVRNKTGFFLGAALAAWGSLVAAAFFCSIELSISGMSPLWVVLPAMTGVHAVMGIGEMLITLVILATLYKSKDVLVLRQLKVTSATSRKWILVPLTLVIIIFLSPLASTLPDGLERIVLALGFEK
jgi:cobalt/nickel transport system permease protein